MPVQKLTKSVEPKKLVPNAPTEPRPKTCPCCNARRIKAIEPITISGLAVWRCVACRAIGYGLRVVNDHTSAGAMGAASTETAYRGNLL